MQDKQRKKERNLKRLVFLLVLTTIISMILSVSKYRTAMAGNTDTKVAYPVMTYSTNSLTVNISPEENEKTYIFCVQNYEEDGSENISEIAWEYTLEIETLSNLPLDFELYTYDGNEQGDDNLLTQNGNMTDYIEMNVDGKVSQKYILYIKWRESEKSYLYSGEIDYVNIVLNGIQKD